MLRPRSNGARSFETGLSKARRERFNDGEGESLTEIPPSARERLDRCARKGWQSAGTINANACTLATTGRRGDSIKEVVAAGVSPATSPTICWQSNDPLYTVELFKTSLDMIAWYWLLPVFFAGIAATLAVIALLRCSDNASAMECEQDCDQHSTPYFLPL
jgi:hypothetical protein